MIFVTVGTHEQSFNRLVEYMDNWAKDHEEKVVIQIGYSSYIPEYAEWSKLFPYQEMMKHELLLLMEDHQVLLCHYRLEKFQ